MNENVHEARAQVLESLKQTAAEMCDSSYSVNNSTLGWIQRLRGFMEELNITYAELGITEDRIVQMEKMAIVFEVKDMVRKLQEPEIAARMDDLRMLAKLIKEHDFTAADFGMEEKEWKLLLEKLNASIKDAGDGLSTEDRN